MTKKAEDANAYYNKQPAKLHVYDAGESVQNMPVKKTEESHKQCSPGEFGMNKEGSLAHHIRLLAEKQAGPVSEFASSFNPLNMYGGSLLGGGAALATPTRSLKTQAEFDSNDGVLRALANALVPGVGPYNSFKRLGSGIRSPEIKAIKARKMQDKAQRELDSYTQATGSAPRADAAPAPSPAQEEPAKAAGWKTEMAGMLANPINLFGGNHLGSLLAALTPTRTLNEQSDSDDSTWSNVFVPGQAAYNQWKRVGAVTRSPEMRAMQNKAKIERLERAAGKNTAPAAVAATPEALPEDVSKAASAFNFGRFIAAHL